MIIKVAAEGMPLSESINLPPAVRRAINNDLYQISTHNAATYYDAIPMDQVGSALAKHGVGMLDEDNTPLKFVMLTGRDGKADFRLSLNGKIINNSILVISWHKMESGRYEFNVYAS